MSLPGYGTTACAEKALAGLIVLVFEGIFLAFFFPRGKAPLGVSFQPCLERGTRRGTQR